MTGRLFPAELVFGFLFRQYTKPREPKVIHAVVTRATAHRIFASDEPRGKAFRAKHPLTETADGKERDCSAELVPWEIALPKTRP